MGDRGEKHSFVCVCVGEYVFWYCLSLCIWKASHGKYTL